MHKTLLLLLTCLYGAAHRLEDAVGRQIFVRLAKTSILLDWIVPAGFLAPFHHHACLSAALHTNYIGSCAAHAHTARTHTPHTLLHTQRTEGAVLLRQLSLRISRARSPRSSPRLSRHSNRYASGACALAIIAPAAHLLSRNSPLLPLSRNLFPRQQSA